MSRQYNKENRVNLDTCALTTKENQNISVSDYNLYNYYYTKDCKCEAFNEHLFENNLVFKDGFGFSSGCKIDDDSVLRLGIDITDQRSRQSLCTTRQFHGGPNLNKGGLIPNIESILTNPQDTTYIKSCIKTSESKTDRFIPLIGCWKDIQSSNNTVYPWTRGGHPTRFDCKIQK